MKKSNYTLISLVLLAGLYSAASVSYALDAPHNDVGSVFCANCHYPAGSIPSWSTVPTTTINTPLNQLCADCHHSSSATVTNDKFADVKTHSSFETGGANVYLIECRDCHNPHLQDQMRVLPADGNLDFGTTTGITATVLSDSAKSWGINQFKDAVLIPNTAYIAYSYRILSNTANTQTVAGPMKITLPYTGVGKPYRIKYGKMVKNSVVLPTGGTKLVTFLSNSGTLNSFASTTAAVKGVCQVCHTKTKYFLGDGTKLDGGHPASYDANCTVACHLHKDGFKAGGCDVCHGNPPADAATLIFKDKDGNPVTSDSPGAGAHSAHQSKFTCANCHTNGMTSASTGDNFINIGFNLSGNLGGNYDGKNLRTVFTYTPGGSTTVSTGDTLNCTTVYCHSSGQGNTANNATPSYPGTAASWNTPGTGACGTCHATTGMSTGNHTKHLTLDTNCGNCHTGASASAYVSTSHVNKSIDVANSYTAGGSAGNGYGACSTASCHSNVYGSGTAVTPTWGSTGNGCSACHSVAIAASGPATGSHALHNVADCSQCHAGATDNITKPTLNHIDTDIDVTNGYPADKTKGTAFASCSTSNCHGTQSPTWGANTATTTCEKCHGSAATNPFRDTAGNTVATDAQVGAHATHLLGSNNYSASIACIECHAAPALVGDAGHYDTALPAENVFGVLAKTGGLNPAYTSPNCSVTYCHGNAMPAGSPPGGTGITPSWIDTAYLNGTPSLTGDCVKCHEAPPLSISQHSAGMLIGDCTSCHDHFDAFGMPLPAQKALHINGIVEATGACNGCHDYDTVNGDWGKSLKAVEGWGAHAQHIDHLKSLAGIATLDPDVDNYTSANFIAVCGVCHTTTESNHTMNNSSGRLINFGDNAVTYRLNNTAPAVYSGTSGSSSAVAAKTCSNVSCHFQATPVWQGY